MSQFAREFPLFMAFLTVGSTSAQAQFVGANAVDAHQWLD